MINIVDRVPKFPGRRLIVPEGGGASFYATVTRADEPIQAGTLLNAVLLKSLYGSLWSGTCTTSGATSAKTADITGFTLNTGAVAAIKFSYLNTAASPTLNVGGTGAKPIYYGSSYIEANTILSGMTALFVYNGSQWVLLNPAESTQRALGTYTGTGGFGAANPNVISLPFTPKFVAINARSDKHNYASGFMIGSNGWVPMEEGYTSGYIEYTISGGTVSWFNTKDSYHQANMGGYIYNYFAIG